MASQLSQTASARFGARIAPQVHAVLSQAASIQGRNLSDFVISAAYSAASEVIKDAALLDFSLRDQQIFAEALTNPPASSKALLKAHQTHKDMVLDDTI